MKKYILASLLAIFSAPAFAATLEIDNAWVRENPGNSRTSAGFVTFINTSDLPVVIVGASSSAAKKVELHTHEMDAQGRISMHKVPQFKVPAHGQLQLITGGNHLMFINLIRPLTMGYEVDVKLAFADGTFQTIRLPVQPLSYGGKGQKALPAHQYMGHH